MNRITLTLIVLFTQAVWAQDWARTQLEKSPRHREWVTVKHDGRSVETFVVYPESKDKRPVVLLIHEIFASRIGFRISPTRWPQQVTLPLPQTCFPEWPRMADALLTSRQTRSRKRWPRRLHPRLRIQASSDLVPIFHLYLVGVVAAERNHNSYDHP